MESVMNCPQGSDNIFGPRVLEACRPFDFTLLFEDAILTAVPAGTFLLLALFRLPALIRSPVKINSHRLATYKLVRKRNQPLNPVLGVLDNQSADHTGSLRAFSPLCSHFRQSILHFRSRPQSSIPMHL